MHETPILFYEQAFTDVCDELHIVTDDGSRGDLGYTSDAFQRLLDAGQSIDRVWAIGPPVMIDGTGMCGGCRVEVGGETKFACVDGPEFDGHQVDFEVLIARLRFYARSEAELLNQHELQPCVRKLGESW